MRRLSTNPHHFRLVINRALTLTPHDRNPHFGADSRPHGRHAPARQAAPGYCRPAEDRPCAQPRGGGAPGPAEVAAAVMSHGGEAVMTRADHPSGSVRIYEARGKLDPTPEP